MKKILSLIGLLAFSFSAEVKAQSTIATARTQAINSTVTVRGIVTNGSELGPIRYLQDNVAGIAAYSPSMLTNVQPGDSVQITGTLKDYNGLLEIDPVSNVTVLASNKPLPAPVVFTAANAANAYAEIYEARLVQITGNTSVTSTAGAAVSTFSGNTNYRLNGVQFQDFRVNSASTGTDGIVGKPVPTNGYNLTGIMSQFAPGGSGGYQLLPRLYSDFDLGNTPNLIAAPKPINITTSSFTVTFQTQNAATSRIDYGTSVSNLNLNAVNATSTNNHSIPLSGLQPATIYYVKATATNADGSSVSTIVPMITASNSSGKMKVYFNKPVDTTYALPNNKAVTLPLTMDDTLVAYINRATESIDLTMYGFNNLNLANLPTALNNAASRGVTVRLIVDIYGNQGLAGLNASIPVVKRNTTRGIMHNKFVVIDANSTNPNKPLVWTGSTNYTSGQIQNDRNSVIIIQDQSLAKAYKMEFDEMWGNGTTNGGVFGPAKTDNTPHHFNINGTPVQLYFSPSDNVNSRLIETIGTADHDLHIATVQVTRSDLANAVKNQVQNNPQIAPYTEMIVDDSSSATTGPYATLRNSLNGRFIRWDLTGGSMHHKHMIVDVGAPNSDPLVWVSSHNWSNNADNENDENTLIIHSQLIANQYYQEFARMIKDLNKGITAANFILTGISENYFADVKTVKVYPNPNAGRFQVSITDKNIGQVNITLTDVTGKTVYEMSQKVNGMQDIKIEANNLPKGLYQLQLRSEKGTQFSKVLIY